jgi:hypothetical protein
MDHVTKEQTERSTSSALPAWAQLPVGRRWLFGIAGVIWSAVGVLLLAYAFTWLAPEPLPLEVESALGGLVVAAIFVRFVFGGIVRKNIARIEGGPARASAWAFQGWKSYLVTVFMIGLGIGLRGSAIPKPALAVIYMGIGVALLVTSVTYHRRFFARPT